MPKLHISRKGEAIEFAYDIVWSHSFDKLSGEIKKLNLKARKACIVTDSNVKKLYLKEVKKVLSPLFQLVEIFVIPAGEENKQLSVIQQMYQHLIKNKFERKDVLFALGGGVVGDMCGFAAATYLRGIDFIQLPTTLLAQVDSSIGGKTGVDFDQFKNMVGAFHQPRLVYMNMSVIKTLPDEEFSSGMGEVLKSGLIRSRKFYDWLEEHRREIKARDTETLTTMIRKCCKIKANVVEEDPKEQGVRAILNFGHTIGHAVEKLNNFEMKHGQCVGYGILTASWLSVKKGSLSKSDYKRILHMNRYFDLPETARRLNPSEIVETMKSDKKMEQGQIKFILLEKIGKAYIDHSITDEDVIASIKGVAHE